MHNVFYSVLPIFLIAILGSLIRRKWLSSDEFWRGVEKLLFYILFPAVLFEYSSKADLSSSEFLRLTIALVVSILIIVVLLVIYQEKEPCDRVQFTSVFQGATKCNNYVFFALGAALFGDEGLKVIATIAPYLLIVTNITAIISFTHYVPKGSASLTKRQSFILMLKSIIGNPFIVASVAGVIFNYMELSLNIAIDKTIQNLADSALAIGILIVGAGIQFKLKQEYLRQVMFTSAIKLVLSLIHI